jgi:flagellar basal body-associated protein FliL
MADKPPETPSAEQGAPPAEELAAPKSSGGFKAWLPLIITIVTMPALAYAMTTFVLAPKLQRAIANPPAESPTEKPAAATETRGGEESPASRTKNAGSPTGSAKGGKQAKVTVALGKVLVNIAGSMGTRYLMANLTLVGTSADFKDKIENNRDQLLDIASNTLGAKTISDLEKQGARNMIRSELLLAFNGAMGDGLVKDIYITEFAVQ